MHAHTSLADRERTESSLSTRVDSDIQAVVLKVGYEIQRMHQELLDAATDMGANGVTAAEDIARIQVLCV